MICERLATRDRVAGMSDKRIGTVEAAEQLGVSRRRVIALIHAGKLPAKKVGNSWIIDPDDLKQVEGRRPGRPDPRWGKGDYKRRR